MKRIFLALLLSTLGAAHAQLKVTAPAVQTCAAKAFPVLGITVERMGGTAGYELTEALRDDLTRRGFQVVPDYSHDLVDLASIGIKGDAEYWENYQGRSSSRIGEARLVIYDVNFRNKVLLNLDQEPARIVWNAPIEADFAKSIGDVIAKTFCQKS
ncbi:hypothetical protein [Deinococcus sp. Marseille-Q6407]|uniref:hypothetical protein n=1 Tax=Deinococcus sp. Marseille-Q6407 TaxID=2969223 RepID=UPI0021C0F78A|nr:hypothetical protein [Deinococcus sp. Marseille-Q6407]